MKTNKFKKAGFYIKPLVVILIIMSLFLAGCSSGNNDFTLGNLSYDESKNARPPINNVTGPDVLDSGYIDKPQKQDDTKIIRIYDFELESKTFNDDTDLIYNIVVKSGGYIESHNIRTHESAGQVYRTGAFVLRIPKSETDNIVEIIKDKLSIVFEASDATDVTQQYYDIQASIDNLESQEQRLTLLYDQAKTIEDIIKVGEKLDSVIYEKEILTRRLLSLDDQITYTSISIRLQEVKEFSVLGGAQDSFIKRVSDTFLQSIQTLGILLVNGALLLVTFWPVILILIIMIIVISKKRSKKRKVNTNAKQTVGEHVEETFVKTDGVIVDKSKTINSEKTGFHQDE